MSCYGEIWCKNRFTISTTKPKETFRFGFALASHSVTQSVSFRLLMFTKMPRMLSCRQLVGDWFPIRSRCMTVSPRGNNYSEAMPPFETFSTRNTGCGIVDRQKYLVVNIKQKDISLNFYWTDGDVGRILRRCFVLDSIDQLPSSLALIKRRNDLYGTCVQKKW